MLLKRAYCGIALNLVTRYRTAESYPQSDFMSKELVLEEILSEGSREVGRIAGGQVVVGREPEEGIAIENQAISREHGSFVRIRNHWFYRDLGSTNGSWKNGKIVKAGQMVLVRSGDVMQLADTPLRLVLPADDAASAGGLAGFPAFSSSTLIVFSGDEFHDEFPLPEYGRALVIGGNQADLRIGNDMNELPRLVIERRGERVCAYGVADGAEIFINGDEVSETVTLHDGDELKVAQYTILFNNPKAEIPAEAVDQAVPATEPIPTGAPGGGYEDAAAGALAGRGLSAAGYTETAAYLRAWDTPQASGDVASGSATSSGRFTFGQSDVAVDSVDDVDVEGTMAIDPAEVEAKLSGFGSRPSARYVVGDHEAAPPLHSIEDKLIVLVGFVLLLVLIAVVAWWVFF